jgi:hypothetical protein
MLSTKCRLLPVRWLVLAPVGGLFSWFEVFELRDGSDWDRNAQSLISARTETLEKWEILGKREMRFRILTDARADLRTATLKCRMELIQELLQRFPTYSHINLNLEAGTEPIQKAASSFGKWKDLLQIELLRERLVPFWRQCGDMAYRSFTAYTITRKDV